MDKKAIWQLLEQVKDPEIPVLSIVDLGIARAVNPIGPDQLEIVITPTYSGCPALHTLEEDIKTLLKDNGYPPPIITTKLSPAWTTDWMSETGKEKLQAYGIAPPEKVSADKNVLFGGQKEIPCPKCGSEHTEQVSEFGSTACKAHYKCLTCREPFDYFKCI